LLGNHQYDVEVLGFAIETATNTDAGEKRGLAAEVKGTTAVDGVSTFTRVMIPAGPGLPPESAYNATWTLLVPDPNEAR